LALQLKSTRISGLDFKKSFINALLEWNYKQLAYHLREKKKSQNIIKGKQIDTRRVDFVVEDYIVEIKARSELQKEDFIQALSYLKASDYPIGLLINFGREKVETRRFVGPKFREKKSDNQK